MTKMAALPIYGKSPSTILLKCHLKGKICRKLASGQKIDYFEENNDPKATSAPALGLNTIIFKHVYWYI